MIQAYCDEVNIKPNIFFCGRSFFFYVKIIYFNIGFVGL